MTFSLSATQRTTKDNTALRESGCIPAVVYGPDMTSVSVSLNYRDFEKLYSEAGEASLINCAIEGQTEPTVVLIQEVQYEPVKGRMVHADLRQISMKKQMSAHVELRFIGESIAVKALGGTLTTVRDEVEVTCLPKDLVSHIDVDISTIQTFDDSISVKDLVLPPGITVVDEGDLRIASVTPPLTEDQLKALEEEGKKGVDAVEQVEKKKKEGEEEVVAEGEAAPAAAADANKADKKAAPKKE